MVNALTNYWDLIEKDVVNIKNGEIMGRQEKFRHFT